jgi:hypothetical protein
VNIYNRSIIEIPTPRRSMKTIFANVLIARRVTERCQAHETILKSPMSVNKNRSELATKANPTIWYSELPVKITAPVYKLKSIPGTARKQNITNPKLGVPLVVE